MCNVVEKGILCLGEKQGLYINIERHGFITWWIVTVI